MGRAVICRKWAGAGSDSLGSTLAVLPPPRDSAGPPECDMERGAVTFDDVAVYFTEEEWRTLQEEQKNLYKEVMNENYQMILSLNRPDLIANIELGCDPYITTAGAGAIPDSWQGERPAASDSGAFQEGTRSAVSAVCAPPLKRQRRYPRVNPFRWTKRPKKSRPPRTSRRSGPREDEAPPADQPEGGGDSREGRSAPHAEGSSNSVLTREEEGEQSGPQAGDGKRTREGCLRSWTMYIRDTKYKPDLRVTLITSPEEEPRGAVCNGEWMANLGRHGLHTAERPLLPPDGHQQDGPTQSIRDAASPPQSSAKTADDLTGAGRSVHPDEERHPEGTGMDSAGEEVKTASPRKREKRVKFSDTVTTFIIEPEDAERGSDGGMKLRSRSHPRPMNVSSAGEPRDGDEEHVATKSQDPKPERKTTKVHDAMGGGSQTSMRSIKKKKTEKVQGSPPRAESGTGAAEPPLATGPQLEPKDRGEEHMATRGQGSKPNAWKATTVRDAMGGGSRDLESQNSKKTEEVEGSPPRAESRRAAPRPQLQPKKAAGTPMDLIHNEEKPQTQSQIPLAPPPPANADQSFVKSYSCSNCSKVTHWTKLNGQQKADVKKSFLHICKMCSRQRDRNKAALSPPIDLITQKCAESGRAIVASSPAGKKPHCSLKADLSIDGPTTKKKQKQEVEDEETSRNPAGHNVQLKKGEEESPRTLTNHNVQLKKGEEESLRNPTNHNVQLKKGEEVTQRNPTNHNVQLKKGEELPRTLTNHNVQLKKGEEESPRTLTNHNVQLKKGEEESPRNPTNHNVQLKNNEEALPRNPTSHIVKEKKNFDPNKCSAAQNFHAANKSNLCCQCGLSASPEDAKLHRKVKAIDGTPPKRASTNVLSSPERRKSNKIPHNEPSSVQEEKLASNSRSKRSPISPQDQKNGGKHGACRKCGKLLLKGHKTRPLTSIQQKKPVPGGCSTSTDKVQRPATKSDAVRKERVKKLPGEPKEKKSQNTEGPKIPRPPRGSRDRVLCTKCGKRLALHVAPGPGGPSEGGSNENECVVLARKKRKCPLAGMEPFTCKECGKIFTRHFTLLQHRLIHTGERPYACKVCGKTFRDSSYLIVHMRSHTKEKPYSCTECGKCFSQNSALHVHLRTHSDERPFSCQDCGKSFSDRSTYRHHLRIHTGEKPYACTYCGKKFTQQPHMKRHETIHTGERPFGCAQCGKRFIERTKLKKHELIHQKGKD